MVFGLYGVFISAQTNYTTLNAHSHNDYEQGTPFFAAYHAHFGSIEADIWEVDGELFVAHDKDQIVAERTLDALYIQPIVSMFCENDGKAWKDKSGTFQLLIDLKSPFETTLALLVEKLSMYPRVFDPSVNDNAVKIVITGNRPDPSQFEDYPQFIFFDGSLGQDYTEQQRRRVALFSGNLADFTRWKGEEQLKDHEEQSIKQIVDSVHALSCKIRFWNAPDTPHAWQTLKNLTVDFINTDHIQQLEDFLKNE